MTVKERVLVYILRRDLRLADNPIFDDIARAYKQKQDTFTHLLPIYIFPANQVEVSGFIPPGSGKKSPYPEARSKVAGFWRCGTHRAKFLAESVWDLKGDLKRAGSDLEVRVGSVHDTVKHTLEAYRQRGTEIAGIHMTADVAVEEKREERDVDRLAREYGTQLKLWVDEKYFVDDRDLPFTNAKELSDVFTTFRKSVEPIRVLPRKVVAAPTTLPPLPTHIPPQFEPFDIPDTLEGTIDALYRPLKTGPQIPNEPQWPEGAKSAHPFLGGSATGLERTRHLISSGAMSTYKDTRNGLVGTEFSTKLSAWLALGCITARQVHWLVMDFEEGKTELGSDAPGYGKGENAGTAAIRFELLWRDYCRLCTKKFGARLFHVNGFRDFDMGWKYVSKSFTRDSLCGKGVEANSTDAAVLRFITGRTGIGLVDSAQIELALTGYQSNRVRQNVASFLTQHLGIDWRVGAEWFECCLSDYDVNNNWNNWLYLSSCGNDPRNRKFNPVKQALDYDPTGTYIRMWIKELHDVDIGGEEGREKNNENLMGLYQAWRLPAAEQKRLGIEDVEWVRKPLVKIDFSLDRRRQPGSRRGKGGGSSRRGGRHGRGLYRRETMQTAGMVN